MKLTITKIFRKEKETKFGKKVSVGIKTKEYGEDRYLNGWEDDHNQHWKEGMEVNAEVKTNGDFLNFKALPFTSNLAPKITASGVARAGMERDGVESEDAKWTKISTGKCKHAFLIEAFKQGLTVTEAEPLCEKWAEASMRLLKDVKQDPIDKLGYNDDVNITEIPF